MKNEKISFKEVSDSFKRFLQLIKRKWLLIAITSLIFASLGLAVSIFKKPLFVSKITFVIEGSNNQSALGNLAGLASQFGILPSTTSSAFNQENLIEILKSQNIVRKALFTENTINNKKELLINHYLRFSGYLDDWKDISYLKNFRFSDTNETKFSRLQDSVINIVSSDVIKKILDVDKLKSQLDIILIKTSSRDEQFSKLLSENLIKSITEFYINTQTHKARETFEFLQKRADSTKSALDAAELQLARWQDTRNQLVKYEAQIDRAKLMRNVEILQVVYSEILKNLELSKMNLLNITPLVKIIDKPALPLDTIGISKLIGIAGGFIIGLILILTYLFISMLIKDALEK